MYLLHPSPAPGLTRYRQCTCITDRFGNTDLCPYHQAVADGLIDEPARAEHLLDEAQGDEDSPVCDEDFEL